MTTAPIASIAFTNARTYADTLIGVSPGLTVIVGASDCGKTNIFRNIVSLIHNDSIDDLGLASRPEGSTVSVDISFADTTIVRLTKGGNGKKQLNDYDIIDTRQGGPPNQTFQSVGNGVPDAVAKALNLGDVDFGGEIISPNLSTQRGPAFLVDSSAMVVAKVIGASSGLDHVFRAVKEADARKRTAATEERASTIAFTTARDLYRAERDKVDIAAVEAAIESAKQAKAQEDQLAEQLADLQATTIGFDEAVKLFNSTKATLATAAVAIDKIDTHLKFAEAAHQALATFRGHVNDLNIHTGEAGLIKKHLAETDGKLTAVQKAIDAFIATHKVCPLCQGAMS